MSNTPLQIEPQCELDWIEQIQENTSLNHEAMDENGQVSKAWLKEFSARVIEHCERHNKRMSYELSGVLIDIETDGLDEVCIETIERVQNFLNHRGLTQAIKKETL